MTDRWCGKPDAHEPHAWTDHNGSWTESADCLGMTDDPMLLLRFHQAEDARIAAEHLARLANDLAVHAHARRRDTLIAQETT